MKKNNKTFAAITIILAIVAGGYLWFNSQKSVPKYVIDQSDFLDGNELIKDIPESQLSDTEIDGLILMREEEKLARDVYTSLWEKWEVNIFNNIADSEQTHTNAVKTILDRYGLEDPVIDESVGVFTSPILGELYDTLVTQGSSSLMDALIVGATVEDLDINDLNDLLNKTDNTDIIRVYKNLNKGSRNHLRAFVAQIENLGGEYSPQYISQELYDQILSSEQERGLVG